MLSAAEDFKKRCLPILRCPTCGSSLIIKATSSRARSENVLGRLSGDCLHCANCTAEYSITEDYIPILLTASSEKELQQPSSSSNFSANIAVYEHISDDYSSHTRQSQTLALRMQNAVRKALPNLGEMANGNRQYHLDFGCGPGHVLSWLLGLGFVQVGMDVSLRNLRNARRATGCIVVLGDACRMPFADASFDVVTESSVLHHIGDWRSAVRESIRVCKPGGGVVIDSEPSQAQMNWSRLACAVFGLRFPVYKVLSYLQKDKYIFRDTERAKLNLLAEIHHQPGTGFPTLEIRRLFLDAGFDADIVMSPTSELQSRATPGWKSIVLNGLSGRNPWNPEYGAFTAIGRGKR